MEIWPAVFLNSHWASAGMEHSLQASVNASHRFMLKDKNTHLTRLDAQNHRAWRQVPETLWKQRWSKQFSKTLFYQLRLTGLHWMWLSQLMTNSYAFALTKIIGELLRVWSRILYHEWNRPTSCSDNARMVIKLITSRRSWQDKIYIRDCYKTSFTSNYDLFRIVRTLFIQNADGNVSHSMETALSSWKRQLALIRFANIIIFCGCIAAFD